MNEDNKRIAKNTLMLYFRMGISMIVSLFTARIVLNTLGVVDYGLFSVVGGVVAMFSFLNSAMASGTQRFLTFELGRGNHEELKRVFSMSLTIHVMIALIVFVLAETVGLWFLNTQMTIPPDRMNAANWVYQFSVLATMISLTQTPYSASIIAHERMSIYAYTGMADVILRLLIIYLLVYIDFDKLKVYAVLTFSVSLLMAMFYRWYCLRNFPEAHFKVVKDKKLFKKLTSFSGWYLFGSLAWMGMGQGQNILLNIFFGPVVNAARGIAFSVSSVIMSFVSNFRMASNPQVVKYYAQGEVDKMIRLVFNTGKATYYLMFLIAIPILFNTEYILILWLKNVPENAVLFCQIVIISSLVQNFDASFGMIFQAVGKIKENQIWSGGIYLLVLPISYIFFKLGYLSIITFYIQLVAVIVVSFIVKVILLRSIIKIKITRYFLELIYPISISSIPILIFLMGLQLLSLNEFFRLVSSVVFTLTVYPLSVYFLGTTKGQRIAINIFIKTKLQRR